MIIPIDPDEYEYGGDCVACWPASSTPRYVYASFSNILRGNDWVPGDPDPPSETFKLTQDLTCRWTFSTATLQFFYEPTLDVTGLSIGLVANGVVFLGIAGPCAINFVNFIQNPVGNKYYGGEASAFWIEPPESPSIGVLCDLLGIPQVQETTALVYPIQPEKQVAKLQNFTENIKISIKRDFA